MKKEFWLIIILAIIILVLTTLLFWPQQSKRKDIQINLPKENAEISSPMEIAGSINGNGWIAFEAQAGTVKLIDKDNNVLGSAILQVTDENWMKQFNNFKAELIFSNPKNLKNAELVFKNENPSGDPSRDKTFTIPVKLK